MQTDDIEKGIIYLINTLELMPKEDVDSIVMLMKHNEYRNAFDTLDNVSLNCAL